MPFQSKAQQRFLFATNPKVAKEFAAAMTHEQMVNLPDHKGRMTKPASKSHHAHMRAMDEEMGETAPDRETGKGEPHSRSKGRK